MAGKTTDMRLPNERRFKPQQIGFFPRCSLKKAGRSDGKHGVPRLSAEGHWVSPVLDREINTLEEGCARVWSEIEQAEAESFCRLRELTENIPRLLQSHARLKDELREAETQDISSRRYGEEALTDLQVQTRRSRELNRSLQPIRNELEKSKARLKELEEELTALYSHLGEKVNVGKQRCQIKEDLLWRRADIYWNAALRHHKSQELPPVPELTIPRYAEALYEKNHRALMETAQSTLTALHTALERKEETDVR